MTVKELIDRLSFEDPNKRIVVDGYESGYDEVEKIILVNIQPNLSVSEKDWEGEFEFTSEKDSEVAILLPRKS
jgi:hypothetical protein